MPIRFDYTVPIVFFVGAGIGFAGFFIAVLNFFRKRGMSIRGSVTTCRSAFCEDTYVSGVLLENQKDKSVTIYSIYLRLGYNLHIVLRGDEEPPVVLKPYETHQESFPPIDLYQSNLSKINLNHLLNDIKLKKRIVLSTSDGKYVIKKYVKKWNINYDIANNYHILLIQPRRLLFDGLSYGSLAKYLVILKHNDKSSRSIPVYTNATQPRLLGVALPSDVLGSKSDLEKFLDTVSLRDDLGYESFEVIDLDEARKAHFVLPEFNLNGVDLSYWRFHILGKFKAFLMHRKMNKQNRKNRR